MYPAVTLVALLVIAQASPSVTVSLDRGWYSPGELVTILIQVVMTDNPTNMTLLWLYIDKPDGHNALFTELRLENQTYVWPIPADAPEGTYTVTVTWEHRYVETGFMVQAQPIPEFPFAPLVLILAAAVTVLTLSWRKAGARARIVASDSGAHMLR